MPRHKIHQLIFLSILAITALVAYVQSQDAGCHDLIKVKQLNDCIEGVSLAVFEIDGCEYIGPRTFQYEHIKYLTHKGNCKFCEARRAAKSEETKPTFTPSGYYNRYK